jgi:hypothetical protein
MTQSGSGPNGPVLAATIHTLPNTNRKMLRPAASLLQFRASSLVNIASSPDYEGKRMLSSRVRRPVVGNKPRVAPTPQTSEEAPEPVLREAVPEHMKLFAEFFQRGDNNKLDPFMAMHERQFLVERRVVLEYVPHLSKLQLTSLLPESIALSKSKSQFKSAGNIKEKASSPLALKQARAGKKSPPKSSLP